MNQGLKPNRIYLVTKVQKKVKVVHIFPLKASVPIYISAGQDLPGDLCPKTFASRGSLFNHKLKHSGEKPHEDAHRREAFLVQQMQHMEFSIDETSSNSHDLRLNGSSIFKIAH